MMPGSVDGPCQASAVAPGAFDPERLNPPVCLGPRDQSLVATRVRDERVIAQTDPPAVDCHRDVDMRMRINTDDHRPRFGRRSYAVGHGLASSDCGPELVRVGGQDCDGPWVQQPLLGHGHPVSWLPYELPAGDDRQVSSQDRRSVKLRVRPSLTGTHRCHK